MPDAPEMQDDSPPVPDDPGRLVPPADESLLKSMPGGVIEPAKDGPTGGWGTAGRWFVLAIFIIALFVVLFWLKPI